MVPTFFARLALGAATGLPGRAGRAASRRGEEGGDPKRESESPPSSAPLMRLRSMNGEGIGVVVDEDEDCDQRSTHEVKSHIIPTDPR